MKGEFLRIACSTPCLKDFIPKAKESLERMKQQGPKPGTTGNSLRKKNISSSQEFPAFLYFFLGYPKYFLRKETGRLFFKCININVGIYNICG